MALLHLLLPQSAVLLPVLPQSTVLLPVLPQSAVLLLVLPQSAVLLPMLPQSAVLLPVLPQSAVLLPVPQLLLPLPGVHCAPHSGPCYSLPLYSTGLCTPLYCLYYCLHSLLPAAGVLRGH